MKCHLHITVDFPDDMPLKIPQDVYVSIEESVHTWNGKLVGALFAEYDMDLECAEYEKGDYWD